MPRRAAGESAVTPPSNSASALWPVSVCAAGSCSSAFGDDEAEEIAVIPPTNSAAHARRPSGRAHASALSTSSCPWFMSVCTARHGLVVPSGGLDCSYERSDRRSPRLSSCRVGARWPSVKAVIVRQVRKPTLKTKGPGARDGERSFGRHPSNSFTTPDTKRTKGPGARDGERSFGRHPQQLVHDPAD